MFATLATRRAARLLAVGALVVALPACNTAQRLANGGNGPELSTIEDPQAKPGYKPISMPMPTPQPTQRNPNSLWRTGSRAFFNDQRATKVGDLLTVNIAVASTAKLTSKSARGRGPNDEHLGVPNMASYLGAGTAKLLGTVDPLVSLNSDSATAGVGDTGNTDALAMNIAAMVIQTLPNGNLVIQGKQQIKVNTEMRELTVTGIVRPEDISADNAINQNQIAEARISYGGQGYVSDVQQPRYGQELLDILLPF
jgi:flagellar L-ring protein precursor FlgH